MIYGLPEPGGSESLMDLECSLHVDQRPAGQGLASTRILACGESRDADSERQGVSTSMVTGTPLVMTS